MITEKNINHFICLHERLIDVYTDYLIKMGEIIEKTKVINKL